MDNPKIKEEFKRDKIHLQSIKSYVKNNWKLIYHTLKNLHNTNYMNDLKHKWWFPNLDGTYTFRNREFRVKDILEIFLNDMLKNCLDIMNTI